MTKTLGFLLSACLAACAGQADVRYSGSGSNPELVALDSDPSVMVVANADEPVFFSENTYWLYRDDHWYRSSSHRGGWTRTDELTEHIRRIDRPLAYVHFRGASAPRTTANEPGRSIEPARPAPESLPSEQDPRPGQDLPSSEQPLPSGQEIQPRADAPRAPTHEPNPQGPQQPYANPRPPQQVPPAVPSQHDGPDRQVAPDPDRAPVSPGMVNRAPDQRPEANPGTTPAAPSKP